MDTKAERKINYRELQAIAKRMRLPGNLKYHLLVEIIEARRTGKEYIVDKILAEQKMERVRRKNEKMEAREAAYQHLRLTQDRKPMGKSRKSLIQNPPTSGDNSSWPAPSSLQNTNIRSLLSMPVESFQELLKKSKEQEMLRAREVRVERPYYYNQLPDNNIQQKFIIPDQNVNFIQDTFPSMRDNCTDFRNGTHSGSQCQYTNKNFFSPYSNSDFLDGSITSLDQINQEGKKNSFQMKDILAQNDLNWSLNYNQGYCNNSLDLSQPPSDLTNITSFQQEPFLPHYSQYLNSNDYWKNMYEINHDNYRRRFVDYSNFHGNPSSFPEPVVSPNSDTVSAIDEDLTASDQQENMIQDLRNNNHSFALPQHYFSSTENQQNQECQDLIIPEVIDCQPIVNENQVQDSLTPMDRDVCYLSVIDHQEWTCEFTTATQSNYIHSVSSHSYVQLN
ncbi:uncharacterized protein [Halyomorpha halys]|uniref:uncharacterized protein isoform X3 n=1 Tax=Halyomorpha halys TaxID=286706 RepID=UPI0006D4F140|nr:uncharacterized protein LOC106686326 isoform X3 [Halyomorpha halys]